MHHESATGWTDKELQDAWAEWVSDMGEWHVFGGLTYDPRRRRRDGRTSDYIQPGRDVVFRHAQWWLAEGLGSKDRKVEAAVVALEYQKNGWPHLHPLLRLSGGLARGDLARLGRAWFGRFGGNRLERPRGRDEVCAYASKYLVKDLGSGDVLLWPRTGPLSVHQDRLRGNA